ncbi:unnamed protein product [Ectocarpus sp. 13 AM-2016]
MKTMQRVLTKVFLGGSDTVNDFAREFPMLYTTFVRTSPVLSSRSSPTCRAVVRRPSAQQAVDTPAIPGQALPPRVVNDTGHRSIAKRDVRPRGTTMDATVAVLASAQALPASKPQHMTKAEKRVAIDVVGRLKTAVDAKDACDVPAVGLLSLSVKCAAINAALRSNRCCPAGAERLQELLSPLLAMWKTAKFVIRSSKEWVTPDHQAEAFNVIGLHLAECYKALKPAKTAADVAIFWPEVAPSKGLQDRTARFAALCQGKGETIAKQQQQRRKEGQLASSSSSSSFFASSPGKDRKSKAFFPYPCPHRLGNTSSGTGSGRTAAPSDNDDDDATGTLSPSSSSPSPSTLSSFFSISSSHSFSGSENITVRQSSLSRWTKIAEKEASALVSTLTSVTTRSSSREGVVPLGRQRKHAPAKVSVSPGVMFVPYRSPTRRANPRGTSLRGSGAIAGRKSQF